MTATQRALDACLMLAIAPKVIPESAMPCDSGAVIAVHHIEQPKPARSEHCEDDVIFLFVKFLHWLSYTENSARSLARRAVKTALTTPPE